MYTVVGLAKHKCRGLVEDAHLFKNHSKHKAILPLFLGVRVMN